LDKIEKTVPIDRTSAEGPQLSYNMSRFEIEVMLYDKCFPLLINADLEVRMDTNREFIGRFAFVMRFVDEFFEDLSWVKV
jgi:hypothetical protein